jgi:NAD(P)-dependent dehydrogenase (short-subunit alcohol dehydrogenase family)
MAAPIRSPHALEGMSAVVTGGNGGLGLGLARGLLGAGAQVCVWGRNAKKNDAALASLDAPSATLAITCDISDEADVEKAMQTTLDWSGGTVHSFFANAAVPGEMQPFVDLSLEDWRATLAINLDGAFLTLRTAARHMVERGGGGALVGVSSVSNFYGTAQKQPYGVSKAGIEALMRSLAVELAPHGIRANTLIPGWTDTPLLAPGAGFLPAAHHDAVRKQTIKRTPAGRWAHPDEFGATAVYLADPSLTFHTGDRVVVDGGYHIF